MERLIALKKVIENIIYLKKYIKNNKIDQNVIDLEDLKDIGLNDDLKTLEKLIKENSSKDVKMKDYPSIEKMLEAIINVAKYVEAKKIMNRVASSDEAKSLSEKKLKDKPYLKEKKKVDKLRYEAQNILNRWIITNLDSGIDRFGSNVVTPQDMQFVTEMREKSLTESGRDVLRELKKVKGTEKVDVKKVKEGYEIDGQLIATSNKDLAIRYFSIGATGSLHWAVLPEEYDKLVEGEDTDKVIEGFASPINHHFKNFGSIFPDEGLGSFFNIDIEGKVSVINPPFIDSILNKAAEKCRKALFNKDKKTKITFIGPFWEDSEYYKMLRRSEYLTSLNVGYHPYVDKATGEIIYSVPQTSWFTLQNYF